MIQEYSLATGVATATFAAAMIAVTTTLPTPALFLPLLNWLGDPQGQTIPSPLSPPERPLTLLTPQQEFSDLLNAQLLALSVRAYERLIARVLRAAGYENVRILRDHRVKRRSHKGRNKHGGVDLTAQIRTEFNTQSVLVQVKQYKRPISRRFVDELRGALLRTQARQGLLITTSNFARGARQAASEDHVGPIHLIDGTGLQELLVRHRLGVGENKRGRRFLRRRFFRRLEKQIGEEQVEYGVEDQGAEKEVL